MREYPMSNDQNGAVGEVALVLPAVLDLTTADGLKQSLLGVCASGGVVEIDAAAVQRITTPALQVFAAAAKGLGEGGGGLHFNNVPEIFQETVTSLGLGELLRIAEI
jgi:chemotaxis protein CheX